MDKIGYIDGRYYASYTSQIMELKKAHQYDQLETLLLAICDAVEIEAQVKNWVVTPVYYRDLAIIYHKQGMLEREQEILERYMNHAQQQAKMGLKERLEKVRKHIQV